VKNAPDAVLPQSVTEVSAMRNLRLFYQKCGEAKYISHLDQTRLMTRAIRRAKLPVWYTEGFNPHVFLTFALPLSLGYESKYEIMDFKIDDDSLTDEEIKEAFSRVMPRSIVITKVAPPVMNVKELGFAKFEIILKTDENMLKFLQSDQIIVEKYSKKKKQTSVFDVKPKFSDTEISFEGDVLTMKVTLPAGNDENINPSLFLKAAKAQEIDFETVSITRQALLNKNKELFV
jgi:radical SAM-linked protein